VFYLYRLSLSGELFAPQIVAENTELVNPYFCLFSIKNFYLFDWSSRKSFFWADWSDGGRGKRGEGRLCGGKIEIFELFDWGGGM
jgi:hypothetical protein